MPHVARIQEIMIACDHPKAAHAFLQALPKWGILPMLQRIILYPNPKHLAAGRKYVEQKWLPFSHDFAPRLHTLKLAWFTVPYAGIMTDLKVLHLSNITPTENFTPLRLRGILEVCRDLQSLEIDQAFDFCLNQECEPILMEALRILAVTVCCENHTKQWCRMIRAPALDEIRLSVDLATNDCSGLRALCTTAGAYPSVSCLRIYHKTTFHLVVDEWKRRGRESISILERLYLTMPHVTELTVDCGKAPWIGLWGLFALNFPTTITDDERVVPVFPFPRLCRLEIQNISLEARELEIIVSVLNSRTRYLRGRRLVSLHVSASTPYSESELVWAALEPLVDEFTYSVSR